MTTQPPEELDAQTPDKHGVVGNQLFTSLLRRCRGWVANPALQRRPAGRSDDAENVSATVAADRAFPAVVAELGSFSLSTEAVDAASVAVGPVGGLPAVLSAV